MTKVFYNSIIFVYISNMNLFGCVYKITCKTSGKFIIGSTLNFAKRKTYYLSYLRRNKWNNKYLQNTFNKYGEKSINFEILQDNIPNFILGDVESIWIGTMCSRAEDGKLGMNMRDGKRVRHSLETLTKMRENHDKYPFTGRNPNIKRPVYQYDKNGNFIKEWKNSREVAESIGKPINYIHRRCQFSKEGRKTNSFEFTYNKK